MKRQPSLRCAIGRWSLPVRGRGLKHAAHAQRIEDARRSPCGGAD